MISKSNITILVVEDEFIISEHLKVALLKLGYQVVGVVDTYNKALTFLDEKTPDIILLDIMIRGTKDGIELAGEIRKKYNIPFIFLTSIADTDTVERAKEVRPDGYLVKPFNEKDLYTSIEIAFQNFSKSKNVNVEEDFQKESFALKDSIFIKKDNLLIKVKFAELAWIKAEGNYIEIHCRDKKILTRSTLKEFLRKVPRDRFVQVHKSYAINIDCIEAIEYSQIIIQKDTIPISRSYTQDLKKRLAIEF